ncbi:MAG: multidrug ABC transporter ATP-binding protein [Chloroflexi bacterium]|nr:MAG: multidrug ABC transporter ATP-binding protein [Chloroflexota bacterium]
MSNSIAELQALATDHQLRLYAAATTLRKPAGSGTTVGQVANLADDAIVAEHLHRVFRLGRNPLRPGKQIVAVEDVSFRVQRGTIFGMLGPNGAGKTTTIKMLSTLLAPSGGQAWVGGRDVVRDERGVRRQLGVVLGGDRGLYAKLSARDNLVYFGNLYGMTRASIERRADELLELVNLRERASERVEGFSRGMKQRLHLAKALLHDPPILVLDEPTIGLDPAAAVDLRRAVANLVPRQTVLLTTHDMHEADQLCKEIAIINHGRIVAQGSPSDLKARVAGERRVIVSTRQPLNGSAPAMLDHLGQLGGVRAVQHDLSAGGGSELTILCADTAQALDASLAAIRSAGATVAGVRVVEPTLEDAFLAIAGDRLA